MKFCSTLVFFLIISAVKAQTLSYEKLDSISMAISELQLQTETKSYKDSKGVIAELSFPEENFRVWAHDRLATKAVYKKKGGIDYLELTEDIDLSKALNIVVNDDYNNVVYVKMDFPPGHLKTQHYEGGKFIKKTEESYLEFFCKYGSLDKDQKFHFDKMTDYLYELSTQLKIEKKLVTPKEILKEKSDWNTLSSTDFIKQHPRSLKALQAALNVERNNKEQLELQKNQNFINHLTEKYKFKRGLTQSEFIAYNPEAAFLFKKRTSSDGSKTTYNNIKALGAPFSVGPMLAIVTSSIVTTLEYSTHCEKGTKVLSDIEAFTNEILSNIDTKYVDKSGFGVQIDVPGSTATVRLFQIEHNNWVANFIAFD